MDFRFLASDAIPYPYGLLLPQNVTEELLIARLHELGGSVERLHEVADLRQDADGVIATVKNLPAGTCELGNEYRHSRRLQSGLEARPGQSGQGH